LNSVHLPSSTTIAIKVVNLEANDEDEAIEEMRKELSILSQCHSEYITRYYGSVLLDTRLWIVMDYCGLGSLRDMVIVHYKQGSCFSLYLV
jgi:serine/threonine-protein kinase 24/25/MST4